jgi:hypothetical protein
VLLPKNDGYWAGAAAMALVVLAEAVPFMFLGGASVAMIMKPTAGLNFAAKGLADLLTRPPLGESQDRSPWTHRKVLATHAMLMIAAWAPFGWRNAVVTGNPFFKIFFEIFRTPYAPELSRVIMEAAPPSQRLKITPLVIALMGILFSNFDMSLRDLYLWLSSGGVTLSFMQRKPNMFLNQYVSRLIEARSPNQLTASAKPRVFATTECNAEYFLNNAEFWHGKKNYPAWTWDTDKLSGAELTQKLIKSNIAYAITDGGSPLALSLAETAGVTLVSRAGPLELW